MHTTTENGSHNERTTTFQAIADAPNARLHRKGNGMTHGTPLPISEYFGELTFGLGKMREKLPRDAYQNLLKTLDHGKKMPRETADAIALVIREWAVSMGATHFCHWFQPMTGLTAEKHDAFISV